MSIPDLPPNTTLEGRSVLVTGANVGLGYASALKALQLGASPVYITTRTASKGSNARDSLLADPVVKQRNPSAVVQAYELEMATWEGVTSFANKFLADRKVAGETLDIAILNAGIFNMGFELAPTGNEAVLQVDYLSTALVALLLLPLLESSTTQEHTARLMIVSSTTHTYENLLTVPFGDSNYIDSLSTKEAFSSPRQRYGLSKLLVVFFLRELSSRVSSDKVIINTVCPGMIKTELPRQAPWFIRPLMYVWYSLATNPVEKGADCYIHAVASVGKDSHGLWYQRMKLTPYADIVTNSEGEELQKRIWNDTMQVLGRVVPGVGSDL
ncbi:NAD(P)-binding protein [Calocera cornea HHB12733]|uniref:NAD(P)-binding protein n=1 Tax=Calocera cornea HHB12733 TaxID=1353952 RepID=A0A165GXV6_9BASI|nr:NAD(P)-binding protein [Calocera cornea HHB12733]